jgi:multicomponent Na+:H+ antiporter subunit E
VIVVAPILVLAWLGFNGELTLANVLGGAVAALAVSLVARPRSAGRHRVSPFGLALLGADLLKRLVVSTWTVAVAVLLETPERTRAGVVVVPLTTSSALVSTIVANGVTLTPGTLTLDAGWDAASGACVLTIHALGIGDPDDLRADVLALERAVLRAVRPVGPRAGGMR